MDPNQVNLNTFLQFLQNANNPQNSNFQVTFLSTQSKFTNISISIPFQNQLIGTTSTPLFQSQTEFGSSVSKSASVGGSLDPISKTPDSQFFNNDGLDAINLDDDDQVKDDDQVEDDEQDNSH